MNDVVREQILHGFLEDVFLRRAANLQRSGMRMANSTKV